MPITLADVIAATGGVAHDLAKPASAQTPLTAVVTDSRQVVPGSLFVAISGERVDGHDYAPAAVADGAVAVLASRPLAQPCIVVEDTVLALGQLGSWVRDRLDACTVVAVTGSSGKTSTKDLIAQVLGEAGPTVAAVGSMNTEVGVPLTMLRADAATRYLVLEMGMRGRGHISYLCGLARPQIGVLLNIGTAHLGVVGSREDIAEAKSEVIADLPADAVAVLSGDDRLVLSLAERTRARVVTFGQGDHCDVQARDVVLDAAARPSFTLGWQGEQAPVQLQLHGAHFVANALAAAAVALSVGLSVAAVAAALSRATARSKWRMEVHQSASGWTVINDAYNANPESMDAALRTLAAMAHGRRTWAVFGGMRELGDDSWAEHAAIGRLAAELKVSAVVAVGSDAEPVHLAVSAEEGWSGQSTWVADPSAAIALLRDQVRPGDVVLVKASRGVGLESVAEALLAANPAQVTGQGAR